MANTKLNPIYAAIDAYQFNRAIKLASALPDSNVLGKALLAHSLTKAGQKHQALITLHKILTGEEMKSSKVFFELQLMLDQQNESISSSAPISSSATTRTEQASTKKGKKGKKKPSPKQSQQRTAADPQTRADLIDRFDTTPLIPETINLSSTIADDSSQSAAIGISSIIADETTLATLAVSLKALNLPLTAFQMYARAADIEPTELLLTKTFTSGLLVLATPSTWNTDAQSRVEVNVLGHMQTVALQLARVAVSANDNSTLMLATAWACQSALWQLEWLPDDERRSLILPRLAESMARKLHQQEKDRNQQSKEISLLCLRILKRQSKWDEILPILEVATKNDIDGSDTAVSSSCSGETDSKSSPASEFGVAMTSQQIKLEKASVLKNINRFEDAQIIYEDLLKCYPDDFMCWKAHLECSIAEKKNSGSERTQGLADKAIKDQEGARSQLRGPHLMVVEIAAQQLQKDNTEENLEGLGSAIQRYAEIFAHRANCTMTDLHQYLNLLLSNEQSSVRNITISLLKFTESLRKTNSSYGIANENCERRERLSKLRAYTFALKLTHKLVYLNQDLADEYLPNWIDVVKEWKETFSLNEGEEKLKELKPGDDLILLAVQQLLFTPESQKNDCDHPDDAKTFISAVLLESAIHHSPDNAYLKFLAIEIFHRLDATTRSWELYDKTGLKHIQLDSCSFLIYPYLFEGGLYNEAIDMCTALLRFQRGAARDCGDFSGRAMNAGTLTKANEFLVFQREKMNRSLTFLYSKGLILDAAPLIGTEVPRMKHDSNPLLKGGIGITQGIVGGNDDNERTSQMVVESHNPYSALSITSSLDHLIMNVDGDGLCDNRDFSILNQGRFLLKPKIESKQKMVRNLLRRSHVHGVLIRASLCTSAMKGPRKGKVVKTSEVLERRTKSLLNSVRAASEFLDKKTLSDTDTDFETNFIEELLQVLLGLCRALSIVNAGLPVTDIGDDSLEQREIRFVDEIQNRVKSRFSRACEKLSTLNGTKSVGSLLPSCILPIFAVFRMCSTVCTGYGWGKRKTTKKASIAMAEFSTVFKMFLEDKMIECLRSLPLSESDPSSLKYRLDEEETNVLDPDVVISTKALLSQSQYRTRMRMEPILQEMIDYLDEFDVLMKE
eukprot:CAMPEP_0197199968 /NCGR_PEP_ID=MMETSP1423-20130617/34157_1 /TAXON_ID=476441 /ORGANISM="Pseudo-nitzschia heimii, Strain UNC1101" /LENGTH=1130 /DNA_ID=CAMNT_0042653841 /DNA_START=98 /DNA_END=3490 /DNA_ORIENTATION=-